MLANLTEEVRAEDLGRGRRMFLLILVSMGSSIIYTPAYLRYVFYEPLMTALDITNAQLGMLTSAYAITATICYLPSGVLADKVRVRTLGWVGFTGTALLTFVYAWMPSFKTLLFVFVGMGITSILIWWGIRFKLVRLISGEDEYSKNIGLSYGIYGAAGLVVGLANAAIIAALADNLTLAVRTMLLVLGLIILALGVLTFFFVPRFAGEIAAAGESSFNLDEVKQVLRTPVVWLAAGTMFFVYFFYTGLNYTTPYLQSALGASLGVVSIVSVVRTYGVTLLSGPVFGAIATKVKSPSKVILAGSLLSGVAFLSLIILPESAALAVLAAVIVIALGFIANGVFGIVSSQLAEGKVPLTIFGTATGILSVVGFMPDTFSSAWFGSIIDAKGVDAYTDIFAILIGSAIIAALFALAVLVYVKRNTARLARIAAAAEAAALAE